MTNARSVPKRKITWIEKSDEKRSHEAISYVGGVGQDDQQFEVSREVCADEILKGQMTYVIHVDNIEVDVEAYIVDGLKYIRTRPDKNRDDNLLSLFRCSSSPSR